MFALLVPILFLSVGWFAHEPVSLFSSSVLFILVLLAIILAKKLNWRASRLFLLALSLPLVYLISAIVNSQSPASLFLGGYQRNYGLATILALSLLFILSANMKLDLEKYLNGEMELKWINGIITKKFKKEDKNDNKKTKDSKEE